MMSVGLRERHAAIIRATRASVGVTTGSPSVNPPSKKSSIASSSFAASKLLERACAIILDPAWLLFTHKPNQDFPHSLIRPVPHLVPKKRLNGMAHGDDLIGRNPQIPGLHARRL